MKKLLTFLMMSLLSIVMAWATEITYNTNTSLGDWEDIVAGKNGTTLKQHRLTTSEGFVLLHTNKNVTGNNTAVGTLNASELRLNSTDDFIISHSSYTITKIVYNYSQVGTQVLSTDVGDYSEEEASGIWNGSASSVSLVGGGSGTQYRITSVTITYDGGSPKCAKPTFSLEEGTYVEAQYVTLSCATEGADILWGYDGDMFVTYDGDPILVNKTMTLYAYAMKGGMSDSDVASATYTIKSIPTVSLPYEENFSENLGDFYVVNEVYPGFAVWNSASYNNKPFAKASGYNGSAKDSESWLISPYINLADAIVPQLSFSQAIDSHFGTIADEATLWVKEKSSSDWIQINITYPDAPTNGYTDFEAQTIDLSAYKGKIIQIAFKYTSSTSNSGSWEVTDVKVQEKPLDKAYYLTGSFNDWGADSDNPQFTKLDDNTFVLRNQEVSENMMFKIRDEYDSWLGGGDQTFNINKDSFRNLPLNKDQAANFCIQTAGTYDFVIKINNGVATLFVPQTTDLYLKGSFDWTDGNKFARNEDGSYTLTEKVLEEASTFKIYDVSDAWYSGNITNITENETTITLQDGDNISIPAGKWTFNIDIAKTTMVVSRVMTPHSVAIDENIENGTVTANPTSAIAGTEITLTVTPEEGYVLDELTVMAGETEIAVENNQFIMPDADVVVSATFKVNNIIEVMFDYRTGAEFAQDNGSEMETSVKNNISIIFEKAGNNQNSPKWYTSTYGNARVYTDNTITIDGGQNYIEKVEFSFEGSNSLNNPMTSVGTYSDGIWTLGGNKGVLTADKTARISYIIVYVNKEIQVVTSPVIEGETPFYPTTTVTITCEDEDATIYYTLDDTDPTAESELYTEEISLTETTTVKAIAVKGNAFSAVASKTFEKLPSVATIEDYKELEDGISFAFTGNVIVTYVNGRNLYVKDETGSALIYGDNNTNFEFAQGQVLEPNWTAKTKVFNGLLEAEKPANLVATNQTVEVVPADMQVKDITTDNDNEYIIVKNVSITEPEEKNFTITDAENETITGRTNFANVEHPTDLTVNYDITCVVAEYNGTVQLYPTKYDVVVAPVLLTGVSFGEGRNWATWYGDQDLALPEGVTAYIVTDISGENAAVDALDYIPAETGVLLNCSVAKESVEAMPYEPETPATVTGNLLVGVDEPKAVSNAYVLYNNAFILIQNGTEVDAHRCYLPIPEEEVDGAPHILRIAVGGTVTSIDDLRYDSNGKTVRYYDLTGRYVGTSLNGKRGIFITSDGKKVVR